MPSLKYVVDLARKADPNDFDFLTCPPAHAKVTSAQQAKHERELADGFTLHYRILRLWMFGMFVLHWCCIGASGG